MKYSEIILISFWVMVDSVGISHLNISITAVFVPSYPVDYIHALDWTGSIQLSRVNRVRGSLYNDNNSKAEYYIPLYQQ